ncbi:thiamine ABC transporter substrate-binding protein [Palleronia caenipelagi]|uniref:Thiamine ABC transporter substrate-binding protein n=1 Tax=Palleronia caenipelagi TaxID=2489174 RepID=A0A547Q5K7_9RHOB|nr:thiamine ABC transporter substrate binding subunit [Palleronia caenipelagi]TRD21670.1 thiamine ABC transporter substrate-binding protein [Palleronia caenipelagi]
MNRSLILALGLLATPVMAQDKPVLTVYAPDYFASEWGPGPAIETAFEAICECDLEYKTGDLLPRLMLEGDKTDADVGIGFTTDETRRARETGLFAPHEQDVTGLTLPVEWDDDVFLPFNWGHTAFVYDTDYVSDPPASFDALVDAPEDAYRIAIQDPRTSISGLALILWVKSIYGDEAGDVWEELAPKILTVTKGWSEAYGLFSEGEADMVLSFTTSPAYHIIAEGDETVKAAIFPEGHYFMVEQVAKLAGTDVPELADQFMGFVLSETFQSLIPEANWSMPAKLPADRLPEGFQQLEMPEKVLFYDEETAFELRDAAIDEWVAALRR